MRVSPEDVIFSGVISSVIFSNVAIGYIAHRSISKVAELCLKGYNGDQAAEAKLSERAIKSLSLVAGGISGVMMFLLLSCLEASFVDKASHEPIAWFYY